MPILITFELLCWQIYTGAWSISSDCSVNLCWETLLDCSVLGTKPWPASSVHPLLHHVYTVDCHGWSPISYQSSVFLWPHASVRRAYRGLSASKNSTAYQHSAVSFRARCYSYVLIQTQTRIQIYTETENLQDTDLTYGRFDRNTEALFTENVTHLLRTYLCKRCVHRRDYSIIGSGSRFTANLSSDSLGKSNDFRRVQCESDSLWVRIHRESWSGSDNRIAPN